MIGFRRAANFDTLPPWGRSGVRTQSLIYNLRLERVQDLLIIGAQPVLDASVRFVVIVAMR
jgi:hypothetical protein